MQRPSASKAKEVRDARYALRGLAPCRFTTWSTWRAVGAESAVFQLLDACALRGCFRQRPHELVELQIIGGNKGLGVNDNQYTSFTSAMWQELQAPSRSAHRLACARGKSVAAQDEKRSARAAKFFEVLRRSPWQLVNRRKRRVAAYGK